ncbi:MAG: hypothetical protein B6I20_09785 [Bacteroidetes bacterium 4572_117]|nr:MAG: hypothetical protein B6I20_09785 [Bacteroidetes bacterium 4572_117]
MSKCKVCGASFPITQFVCEYCGHVETERITKIDEGTQKEISFKDSMNVIHENLNALEQIHRPSISEGIVAVFRIYVAILTFGIVLLFWKKPEKRFNKKEYNKLKAIVARNIELLKLSAKGSDQLQERIGVAENNLKDVDNKIKTSIRTKQFVTVAVVVLFFGMIYLNKEDLHESGINVIPVSSVVAGNIGSNFEILVNKYPVFYILNEEGNIDKIKVVAKIQVISKHKLNKNELLNISMQLINKDGDKISSLSKTKLKNSYVEKVGLALEQGSKRELKLPFYFEPENDIKKVSGDIEKFSISATIDTVQ